MIRLRLAAAAGILALSACSGSALAPSAVLQPTAAPTPSSYLYAAKYNNGVVEVYDSSANRFRRSATLSGFSQPQNLAVDTDGNLYVANTHASNVPVFRRGETKAFRVLDDSNEYPVSVFVARDGTAYVANILDRNNNPGNLRIYPPGSNRPARTLDDGFARELIDVTLDSHGNCYVSYVIESGGGYGSVDEFVGCRGKPMQLVGVQSRYPGGIALDSHGRLIVADQRTQALLYFEPPYTRQPDKVIPVKGDPLFIRLSANERRIYVANTTTNAIDVLDYPSGRQITSIATGAPSKSLSGVAVDPPFYAQSR